MSDNSLVLVNEYYNWNTITLTEFLKQGNIPSGWSDFFTNPNTQNLLEQISEKLRVLGVSKTIYPNVYQVFRAFYMTPLNRIRAIIIGQDPYHNGSATGLCFSVKYGNTLNPSIRNIYKELRSEGFNPTESGILSHWAEQGVFLLNATLTVEKGKAGSHSSIWRCFYEHLIEYITSYTYENDIKIHWLLFGRDAQQVREKIKNGYIHCTSHPSPFSAHKKCAEHPAFLGSGVFKHVSGIVW
jgi:uracil-DNA glycosylase